MLATFFTQASLYCLVVILFLTVVLISFYTLNTFYRLTSEGGVPVCAGSGGCMGSLCRCLAGIPCGAMCVFVTFASAVIACGSSLIVGMHRTRNVLDQQQLWAAFTSLRRIRR